MVKLLGLSGLRSGGLFIAKFLSISLDPGQVP
jgi:hypothetical protein